MELGLSLRINKLYESVSYFLNFDSDLGPLVPGTGNGISKWGNRGAYGVTGDVTQSTAVSQPETGLVTINGLNALKFTEADHEFLGAGPILPDSGDYTIFAVCQADLVSGNIEQHLISIRDTSSPFPALFVITFTQSGRVVVRWATGVTGTQTSTGIITHNTPFLLTVRLVRNQAQGLIRVDGITEASGFTWAPAATADFLIGTGFRTPNLGDFQGSVAAIKIARLPLSISNIIFEETALKTKWGIS